MNDIKIVLGIDEDVKEAEIDKLAELGADEFYCGVLPPDWKDVYGTQVSTNRRYNIEEQFTDFGRFRRAAEVIHRNGKKITVAFNAPYYIEEQCARLAGYVKKCRDYGADAFIVSDPDFFLQVLDMKLGAQVHISGEAATYNSRTAKFYKSLGANRIIFPRHLTINEIEKITKEVPGIEYESFIMEQRCPFEGAFCTTSHGWLSSCNFCQEDFARGVYKLSGGSAGKIPPSEYFGWKNNNDRYKIWALDIVSYLTVMNKNDLMILQCGLCGIKKLSEAGVGYLKIAARGSSNEAKMIAVSLVKKVTGSEDRSDEFCRSVRGNPEICGLKYMCYYR
jgi:putative protease